MESPLSIRFRHLTVFHVFIPAVGQDCILSMKLTITLCIIKTITGAQKLQKAGARLVNITKNVQAGTVGADPMHANNKHGC